MKIPGISKAIILGNFKLFLGNVTRIIFRNWIKVEGSSEHRLKENFDKNYGKSCKRTKRTLNKSSWNWIYNSWFSQIIESIFRSKINSNQAYENPGYFKGYNFRNKSRNIPINYFISRNIPIILFKTVIFIIS